MLSLGVVATVPGRAAAELKIGFIDSDRIFADYRKTQEAQESFNREVQDLSKTAREKKNEIDDLQRKLDQQGPMLSEAKKDEQNQLLQKKISEYEAFVQTNWGPNGRITKLNEEYLKPIIDRVHAIVADIGTDEAFSLILDAADGNVVYGDKSLDLTDRVLSELRTEDETGIKSVGGKGGTTGGQ
ncbi:MAG TPA: OmpH family outer membrane protein [Candidatus Eisenbacteria bacterium]